MPKASIATPNARITGALQRVCLGPEWRSGPKQTRCNYHVRLIHLYGGGAFIEARDTFDNFLRARWVTLPLKNQMLFEVFDAEVTADLSSQVVIDFTMTRYRRPFVLGRIVPPRMTAPFS